MSNSTITNSAGTTALDETRASSAAAQCPAELRGIGTGNGRKEYIAEIDGLRLVAYGLVLLHHICYEDFSALGTSQLAKGIAYAVHVIHNNGWVGVDLFFVLSGFLITSILVNESKSTGDISLKNFYIRRTLRIFPVYYVFLLGVAAIAWFTNSMPKADLLVSLLCFATFADNLTAGFGVPATRMPFSDPLWSLCIEEHFYLVWGWILKRIQKISHISKLLFGAYALSLVVRTLLVFVIAPESRSFYTLTPTHLDGLILGSLAAVHRDAWLPFLQKRKVLAHALAFASISGLAAAIFMCADACDNAQEFCVLMTLAPLFFTGIMCTVVTSGNRFLAHPIIAGIGQRTYVMYVVQTLVIHYICFVIGPYPATVPFITLWVFLSSLLIAEGARQFIELPMARLRKKLNA